MNILADTASKSCPPSNATCSWSGGGILLGIVILIIIVAVVLMMMRRGRG